MLLRSAPAGDAPWRGLLLAALVAMALPSALGGLMLGGQRLLGLFGPGAGGDRAEMAGMLLAYSPALSFAGMMLVVPIARLLLRLGWFGWLPAALVGLGIGTGLAAMAALPLAAPFGLCQVLILRAAWGRLTPAQTL